jgi:hypothetical protein
LDEFVFITTANDSYPVRHSFENPYSWVVQRGLVCFGMGPIQPKKNPTGIKQQGKPYASDTFVQVLLVWRLGPYLF